MGGGGGGGGISIQNPFDQSKSATKKQQSANKKPIIDINYERDKGDIIRGINDIAGAYQLTGGVATKAEAKKAETSLDAYEQAEAAKKDTKEYNKSIMSANAKREAEAQKLAAIKKRQEVKGGMEKSKLRSANKIRSAIGSIKTVMPRIG